MTKLRHKLDRDLKPQSRSHIKVILVAPQKAENIGATARAIGNMGLGGLYLVKPSDLNWEKIRTMATAAGEEVVGSMKIFSTLEEALADCHLIVGTTARFGAHRGPFYTPRQLAPELINLPLDGEKQSAAIVFGPERTGLSTADLRFCQKVVRIPTDNPDTSSLNLAQAVLILGYELLMAAGGEPLKAPAITPAPGQDLINMYKHLEGTLVGIGFLPAKNSGHWLMNLKKIFNRSLLTQGECGLIRGVCRQVKWAIHNPDKVNWPDDDGEK